MPTTMIAVLVLMMVGDDVDDDNHPVGYNDRGKHGTVARFSLLFSLFLIQRSSV